jgi:hypothetical protein
MFEPPGPHVGQEIDLSCGVNSPAEVGLDLELLSIVCVIADSERLGCTRSETAG